MIPWRGSICGLGILAALSAGPVGAGVPGMMDGGGAGSPVRTQPLAADERLIEVGGIGVVTTRADLATMTVSVSSSGASGNEARRANEIEVRRIVETARRAGVPAEAIETRAGQPVSLLRIFDVADAAAQPMDGPGMPERQAHSEIVIRLRDIDKVAEVRAALALTGTYEISTIYALTDRNQARHRAQAQAVAAAQADAAAHAGQANMRVARLVRLTERTGMDVFALALNHAALFRSLRNTPNPAGPQTQPDIVTIVMLGADYALAPR
jgi:uncharacterized protein YggE